MITQGLFIRCSSAGIDNSWQFDSLLFFVSLFSTSTEWHLLASAGASPQLDPGDPSRQALAFSCWIRISWIFQGLSLRITKFETTHCHQGDWGPFGGLQSWLPPCNCGDKDKGLPRWCSSNTAALIFETGLIYRHVPLWFCMYNIRTVSTNAPSTVNPAV